MISLIVATVNRVDELDRLLSSLEAQSFREFEVIVVDQNPDDRLLPLFRDHHRLTIQHLHSALGLSRARNVGLRAASGALIAVPDDDCWYPPGLLASVADWFESHAQFGLLGTSVRTAGGQLAGPNSPDQAQSCTKSNILRCGVSTALFMRRIVSDVVGDFDEDIGAGADSIYQSGEETDYILRAFEGGFQMWFEPSLTVYHPPLDSLARLKKTTYPFALGTGWVLRRHGFQLHQVGGQLVRSFGGAAVSLGRGELTKAWVYALRGAGQLAGYVSGRRAPDPDR